MTSPSETEQTFLIGQSWNNLYRDRYSYQRDTLIQEAIRAWRLNPLARQIANLYKIYNVDGIGFKCDHEPTQKFLENFWRHELNDMDEQLEKIANELFLTGDLFSLFTVDDMGMVYHRVFPTDQIERILTAENDVEQEIGYLTKPTSADVAPRTFVNPRGQPSVTTPVFMKHEAINRLAGAAWGEGEIWPDLPWLGRYATWLEDRVRLNHFRNAFMFVVQGQFASEEEKRARQAYLNANPPKPGSVLVTDPSEQWGIMSASLDSFDASVDGIAIKKMVMVNQAPMHYAAEPESSTRTTADAAGTPTFKAFENRQAKFKKIIHNILTTALKRRAEKDSTVKADATIEIISADATERDNAGLALATSQIVSAIGEMFDRGLIDSQEYTRLVYRFSGEELPSGYTAPQGIRRDLNSKPGNTQSGGIKTDSETGETKVKDHA